MAQSAAPRRKSNIRNMPHERTKEDERKSRHIQLQKSKQNFVSIFFWMATFCVFEKVRARDSTRYSFGTCAGVPLRNWRRWRARKRKEKKYEVRLLLSFRR